MDNDENVDSVNISSGEAWYDEDGNIVMFDAEDGRAVGWTGYDGYAYGRDELRRYRLIW